MPKHFCYYFLQYDLSASQFSPDGRVFQVEYAAKAVENSGTVIGLRGKDGVVFAVEKLVTSKLYEPGANKRIFHVDEHVGMVWKCLLLLDSSLNRITIYLKFVNRQCIFCRYFG